MGRSAEKDDDDEDDDDAHIVPFGPIAGGQRMSAEKFDVCL